MKEKEIDRLLLPKFEVIADWPWPNDKETKVGDVVLLEFNEEAKEYATVMNSCYFSEKTFRKYPHLFRELKWWQKRNKEDLPKYVKSGKTVYKVKEFVLMPDGGSLITYIRFENANRDGWPAEFCEPATEAEYEKGK